MAQGPDAVGVMFNFDAAQIGVVAYDLPRIALSFLKFKLDIFTGCESGGKGKLAIL